MLKTLVRIAKRLLAVPAVRKTYEGATRGILEVGGSSRLSATVYSLVGLATFNREQWAVLSGRRQYYRNLGSQRPSHVELRRNIHRLEKGLAMQPRRATFARDYIGETVEFYTGAVGDGHSASSIDQGELTWSHDVLAEYFRAITAADPIIDRARSAFEALPPVTSQAMHPYEHQAITPSNVPTSSWLGCPCSGDPSDGSRTDR